MDKKKAIQIPQPFSGLQSRTAPHINSSFHRTDHNALYKIFLHKRINTQNRHSRQNDRGIFDRFRELVNLVILCRSRIQYVGVCDQDCSHNILDRQLIIVLQINGSIEPGIPVTYSVVQEQYGKGRFDQRNHNFEQNDQIIGAVNIG